MSKPRQRAAPLTPEERRRAIVAATVPLLRSQGADVTTREIAAAAGVAEGTLFHVFADKESIIEAAVGSAFDPERLIADLAKIDRSEPLEDRLVAAVSALQRWLRDLIDLMISIGRRRPPMPGQPGDHRGHDRSLIHSVFHDAVADLIGADRELLGTSPANLARLLRMLAFAGTHPALSDGEPLGAAEIVSVVLHGVQPRPHD